MNVIEFNHVWKKFKKGEKFKSLREAVPNLFKPMRFRHKSREFLDTGEFWALKDVSIQLEKEEVLGIIGPNGAGKSTILKLLTRIMKPNKGEIHVKGRISALIEVAAGFHPELTGRENVYLNGTIIGMTKKEIDKKFDEIVEFSGVREFIDTPVKRYSFGMNSRLGFSVAAHMEPDVLLIDEVLAVGDMAFHAKCAQKMRELLDSGATIILISHNLSLIQSLCQRVILLDKGVILKEGTAEDVIPWYQDLVQKQREEELKRKTDEKTYKVKIDQDLLLKISDVAFYGEEEKRKENFRVDELISIKVHYKAKEKIKDPIFRLEIIRSDGVICCLSDTSIENISTGTIFKEGVVKIHLNNLNLAPGIYLAKFSVWDKDFIHRYLVRHDDVFKIGTEGVGKSSYGVFLTKVKWEIGKD